MIRKSILAAFVVVVCAGSVWAQHPAIELNFYADYLWTTRVSATVPDGSGGFTAGNFDIKNNPAYGIALDVEVRPGTQVELLYERQESEMEFIPNTFGSPTQTLGDVTTSYYHIGALQGFRRGNVMPFTGGTIGATSLDPSQAGDTKWEEGYREKYIKLFDQFQKDTALLSASAKLFYNLVQSRTIQRGTFMDWSFRENYFLVAKDMPELLVAGKFKLNLIQPFFSQ